MPDISNVNNIDLQIMVFLYNALNDGWEIKKKKWLLCFQ